MQEPPARLLARCRQGDTEAFAQIVAQQQAYVYNLAYRLLGHAEEARDLAQEALLRAWLMLPSFRGESRFTTWLYRLVVNLGLNRKVSLRRQLRQDSIEDLPLPDSSELAANPQQVQEASEKREFIWHQVDRLPEKYRLVITLYYQLELSYQEIAEVLQLPLNTVKTHLARARHMLAERLVNREEIKDDL